MKTKTLADFQICISVILRLRISAHQHDGYSQFCGTLTANSDNGTISQKQLIEMK